MIKTYYVIWCPKCGSIEGAKKQVRHHFTEEHTNDFTSGIGFTQFMDDIAFQQCVSVERDEKKQKRYDAKIIKAALQKNKK